MFQSVARNGFNTSEGVAAQVLRRYGMALLVVLAAGLLRWSLRPALGTDSPFMTFYVAVVIAAVLGWGPGLFSTALGAVLGLWLTGGWLRATEDPLE
ncbi:MAG TPA: hypothetical protein VN673_00395, partial [Clostridia bacterium]|nr:hypothetical protein [Clostridia bacterium]